MRVWVIMGNDFPEAVKLSEKDAEDFIKKMKKKEEKEEQVKQPMGPRPKIYSMGPRQKIYWRSYEFETDR